MTERQRWRSEEDALLCAYVKQYGPREWHLISQRMNVPLNRDAKSCAERWKNYLRPGIKQGSLTEEEQHLLIHLQAKHGNKWKKIAAEIPGRTSKRLGKWWEVFKERQQRELKESNRALVEQLNERKYDRILENFAEKLVKEQLNTPYLMAAPLLPSWLSNSTGTSSLRQHSPSVTLTLSPSNVPSAPFNCLQGGRAPENVLGLSGWQRNMVPGASTSDIQTVSELVECCRELEEGHRAWLMHKKEAAWRLRRVELHLELDKACKRREKIAEIEAKVRALREQQEIVLERIEAGYREQISGLRRDEEAKEQQLIDQWAAKHVRLSKFLEQMGCHQWLSAEMNGW